MSTRLELGILESLHEIHEHILKERTGGLVRFAEKLNMHPSTLKRRLEHLRLLGADVRCDKIRGTYYYHNEFVFEFKIEFKDR